MMFYVLISNLHNKPRSKVAGSPVRHKKAQVPGGLVAHLFTHQTT